MQKFEIDSNWSHFLPNLNFFLITFRIQTGNKVEGKKVDWNKVDPKQKKYVRTKTTRHRGVGYKFCDTFYN